MHSDIFVLEISLFFCASHNFPAYLLWHMQSIYNVINREGWLLCSNYPHEKVSPGSMKLVLFRLLLAPYLLYCQYWTAWEINLKPGTLFAQICLICEHNKLSDVHAYAVVSLQLSVRALCGILPVVALIMGACANLSMAISRPFAAPVWTAKEPSI